MATSALRAIRLCLVPALVLGCAGRTPGSGSDAGAPAASATAAIARSPGRAAFASSSKPSASTPAADGAAELAFFQRVFGFSEAGEPFLSDNLISNETSYLDAAPVLRTLRGGAYLGVGPEQNFSYIASARPELAFMVDLRRDNALLHLLYKAIFERAATREEFLGLLLGRPLDIGGSMPPDADIRHVIETVERHAPDRSWFLARHDELARRIQAYGLGLSDQDLERIRRMHEEFVERQLELRFELHEANGRRYPSLRELMESRAADGGHGSFLASEEGFRQVKDLERRHRIIPVVCDVSHPEPLRRIAAELRQRNLPVRVFYISNVEQYLLGTPAYGGWLKALGELPTDDAGVLVRSYLDQGRPHPAQRKGHRTTTLVHSIPRFLARAATNPYRSYHALASDASLSVAPAAAR